MNEADELLTVTEAARRLGISERQARRDVRQLSGADRHESGRGPVRVRLSALRAFRSSNPSNFTVEAGSTTSSADVSGTSPAGADTDGGQSRSESGAEEARPNAKSDDRDDRQEALIAQLTGENQRLNAALERAQEGLLKALDSLADERVRVRQLEQLEARLIHALPAPAAEVKEAAPEEKRTEAAPWWVRLFGQKD